MNGQFEEEERKIIELVHGETPQDDDLNILRDYIDNMLNVSNEVEVNASHLQTVFTWLTVNEDVDWNDIMEGTHPDLEELVSVLNGRPSLQEESLSRDDLLNTLPGHSDSCLTNTEMESASAKRQEEGTSELQSKSDKQSVCSKTIRGTRRILDFNLDDDCNEIVTASQEAIDTRLRTGGEIESVLSKQDKESSGDETQDPTDSKSLSRRRKVNEPDPTDSKSPSRRRKVNEHDRTDSKSPSRRRKVDEHDPADSKSPSRRRKVDEHDPTDSKSPSRRRKVDENDDQTQDPTESEGPLQRRKVDDLFRDSKRIIRNLTEANRKFKEIIKDPYHQDDSNDEVGSADGPSRTEKRKKYLAPQKDAKQMAWDESDSDSSFDDVDEQRCQGTRPVSTPSHTSSASGTNLVVTIPPDLTLSDSGRSVLAKGLKFVLNLRSLSVKTGIAAKKKKIAKCAWSQDEMDFIRDGVRKFGVGEWARIRDHYPFNIAHRNSCKIKDKYRNMAKNGLIVELESESNL